MLGDMFGYRLQLNICMPCSASAILCWLTGYLKGEKYIRT